jgi:uncharacterized protein YggT (Ycf19 family)
MADPYAELPYHPHAPRSSRTIAWMIGRAVVWLVYAFTVAAIVIATIAFFLQLAGANPTANFVNWIYRSTARLMQPFRGIFPNQTFSDQSVLNVSLLFAIFMYGLFALLTSELVGWLDRKRAESAGRDRYNQQREILDLRDQTVAPPPARTKQPVSAGSKPRATSTKTR